MADRDKKNLGGAIGIDRALPSIGASHTNVINAERLLIALLRSEVERFQADPELLKLFFSHMFDPIVGEEERDEFLAHFARKPPEVVLGYPRSTTTFPCFAVVLNDDAEDETFIGDYGGMMDESEADGAEFFLEYSAALCQSSYAVYIYAQNPDVCLYLYYFAKMIVFGAKPFFLTNGFTELHITGGEVAPDEQYLPDGMFMRQVTLTGKSMFTVPQFAIVDPRRLRVLGLYRDDVVVDGVRGGIFTPEDYDGSEENNG